MINLDFADLLKDSQGPPGLRCPKFENHYSRTPQPALAWKPPMDRHPQVDSLNGEFCQLTPNHHELIHFLAE